jgi:hypothetical protein
LIDTRFFASGEIKYSKNCITLGSSSGIDTDLNGAIAVTRNGIQNAVAPVPVYIFDDITTQLMAP